VTNANQGTAELVYLGDSITAGWEKQSEIWTKSFGKYNSVKFGIGGDRTQDVRWHIENGELEGIHPKAVVLIIGTNNSGIDSTDGMLGASRRAAGMDLTDKIRSSGSGHAN
jgi:lysophospholipase L1-like esterase